MRSLKIGKHAFLMSLFGLKKHIKKWLAKHGYFIVWVPGGAPTGIVLENDLERMIASGAPVVVDVGANVGQTIDLIYGSFPSARIVAVEASTRVCQELRRTHGSKCWQIHHVAMGEADGTQEFINYESSVFSSLLRFKPSEMHHLPRLKEIGTETVVVRCLDTMIPELGLCEIDLLKIDTQGNDLNVLRGGKSLLQRGAIKRVQVELNFFQMYEGEGDAISIMGFLKAHRFHLVELYEKSRNGNVITWCTGLFEHEDTAASRKQP